MFTNLLRGIAKRFVGTGISKYVPFSNQIFESLYRKFNPEQLIEVAVPLETRLRFYTNDSSVGLVLLNKGEYEPFQTAQFIKHLDGCHTFVDIGANIGYYTVIAAKKMAEHGQVIAFEPNFSSFELLKQNLELNGFTNVSAENIAIGKHIGKIGFIDDKASPGNSHIVNAHSYNYEVVVKTMDNFISEHHIHPQVIKIDIEGAEIDALHGMNNLLNEAKDLTIFIEYNPSALSRMGQQPEQMIEILLAAGFQLQIIDEQAKQLIAYSSETLNQMISHHTHTNLLCIKHER